MAEVSTPDVDASERSITTRFVQSPQPRLPTISRTLRPSAQDPVPYPHSLQITHLYAQQTKHDRYHWHVLNPCRLSVAARFQVPSIFLYSDLIRSTPTYHKCAPRWLGHDLPELCCCGEFSRILCATIIQLQYGHRHPSLPSSNPCCLSSSRRRR